MRNEGRISVLIDNHDDWRMLNKLVEYYGTNKSSVIRIAIRHLYSSVFLNKHNSTNFNELYKLNEGMVEK